MNKSESHCHVGRAPGISLFPVKEGVATGLLNCNCLQSERREVSGLGTSFCCEHSLHPQYPCAPRWPMLIVSQVGQKLRGAFPHGASQWEPGHQRALGRTGGVGGVVLSLDSAVTVSQCP